MTLKTLIETLDKSNLSYLYYAVACLCSAGVGWAAARRAPEGVEQEVWERFSGKLSARRRHRVSH